MPEILVRLKAQLEGIQNLNEVLQDAAIGVATEQRMKVRKSQRAGARRRREAKLELRISGFTAREARVRVRGPRKGSGISIDAHVDGHDVVLRASKQVNHFRRIQAENVDIMEAYRRNIVLIAEFRARRGR